LLGSRAAAPRTRLLAFQIELHFAAAGGYEKRYLELVLDIAPGRLALASSPGSFTGIEVSENAAEIESAEIGALERIRPGGRAGATAEAPSASTRAGGRIKRSGAKLIILLSLLGVSHHVVCLLNLLELSLGRLVTRIHIGMILARKLAIRSLDLLVRCVTRNAQYAVEILVRHPTPETGFETRR
jgi:hypothetical protein